MSLERSGGNLAGVFFSMQSLFAICLLVGGITATGGDIDRKKPVEKMPFSIYSDHADNFVPSGWIGDTDNLKLNVNYTSDVAEGTACVQVIYKVPDSKLKWAGVYWQSPANNWGDSKDGGYNLFLAKRIRFKARGGRGGEVVAFKAGGMKSGPYPDTFDLPQQTITLTAEWKDYELPLQGCDLTHVIGGFCFIMTKEKNPEGAVFYLDSICYSTF